MSGSSIGAESVSTLTKNPDESPFDVTGNRLWDTTVTLEDYGLDDWRYPLHSRHQAGSPYGRRRSPIKNGIWGFHNGVDIGCARGEKVYAATGGVVKYSLYSDSAGNYIRIMHENSTEKTIETRYLHLSRRYVKRGDEVEAGQLIGRCGNTGHSTSSHLHFEVILDGERVQPLRKPDRSIYQVSPPSQGTSPYKQIILPSSSSHSFI